MNTHIPLVRSFAKKVRKLKAWSKPIDIPVIVTTEIFQHCEGEWVNEEPDRYILVKMTSLQRKKERGDYGILRGMLAVLHEMAHESQYVLTGDTDHDTQFYDILKKALGEVTGVAFETEFSAKDVEYWCDEMLLDEWLGHKTLRKEFY